MQVVGCLEIENLIEFKQLMMALEMIKISFEQFAKSAHKVPHQKEQSYLVSYREFITYFENLEKIEAHNFIIATHFTYGWMPTILQLEGLSEEVNLEALYPHLVEALNKVKKI